MKKQQIMNIFSLKGIAIIGITSAALVFSSCSKEEDAYLAKSIEMEAMAKKGPKKAPMKSDKSIAAIADEAGVFTQLLAALAYVDAEEGTNLVELFSEGTDQYTVFAPSDDAFFALYEALGVADLGGLAELLGSETILNVLLYHVTDGRRAANSVVPPVKERTIETLLPGATFSVDTEGKITAVGNEAEIAAADISASNGIIHVISAVILPI